MVVLSPHEKVQTILNDPRAILDLIVGIGRAESEADYFRSECDRLTELLKSAGIDPRKSNV